MSKLIRALLCAGLCLALCVPCAALEVSASCAVLMDADSGRILWSHNADEKRYIASITKMMTALVVVESGHSMDEMVDIRPEYTGAEGSSMYLKAGERLSLESLMYGLLLASGNDAALAVAGYCYGSVDAFVEQMNRKAAVLGMENTHFENPSGLTEEGHMSTAADMAKLASVCIQHEVIARMVATRSVTSGGRTFTNHNKLLWRYDGCIGMKTGYTERSGRTLISCAKRDGRTLVAVTLNDPNDWVDHTAMLDYGFSHYDHAQLSKKGALIARLPVMGSLLPFVSVIAGDTISYPLAPYEQIREEVSLVRGIQAPVMRGQTAGTISYYLEDRLVAVCPLVYSSSADVNVVRQRALFERMLSLFG